MVLHSIGVFAISVRDVVCVAFNSYFAMRVFFNMNAVVLFSNSRLLSFIGHSLALVALRAYVTEDCFLKHYTGNIGYLCFFDSRSYHFAKVSWDD